MLCHETQTRVYLIIVLITNAVNFEKQYCTVRFCVYRCIVNLKSKNKQFLFDQTEEHFMAFKGSV